MFSPKNFYSKEDLVACSNGDLFTKDGDGRLPSDQMLMFDEIINIDDHSGNFNKGSIEAELNINLCMKMIIKVTPFKNKF